MKTAVLAVLAVVAAIAYWLWMTVSNRKGKKLPPGPFRWPLVGNMVQTAMDECKYQYETFSKYAAIYGPVFFLRNGAVNTVVVNGYDDCKKIFTNDEWLERTDDRMILMRLYEKRLGILYGHLNLWKASRRFTMRNLRDYGFGKKEGMEVFIRRETSEIEQSLDQVVQSNDGHFEPHHVFDIPALNIIWALLTGTRFNHDDPKVRNLVDGIIQINHSLSFYGGVLSAYPILHKVFPDSVLGLKGLQDTMGNFRRHMEQLLDEYRAKGTYRSNPGNFVEQFLQHIDLARAGKIEDPEGVFTDQNLVCILYDLFWAGSDTTSSTTSYAILWLTIHQDYQQKLRNELRQFIDRNGRMPTLNDRNELPYTRATILEVHRRSFIVPMAPRKVYVDTEYDDFLIPKGTNVMINYHSVLMDKSFWGDPENFRPERFLDSNNQIIKADHVIPFGLGKRNCLGDTLAEASIFLFMIVLFSKYEFHPISDNHEYDTDPVPGIVMAPKKFAVRMKAARSV